MCDDLWLSSIFFFFLLVALLSQSWPLTDFVVFLCKQHGPL